MLVAVVTSTLAMVFNTTNPSPPLTGMNCGGTSVCGVLTLESGLGSGTYSHDAPAIHGLWPETGAHGSSSCIAPSSSKDPPTKLYSCYAPGGSEAEQISFEQHEWSAHGVCAGVADADDFFTQICNLAQDPLSAMAGASKSLDAMQQAVEAAGYEVFDADTKNEQLQLSACLDAQGKWHLAAVSTFASVCGDGPAPPPSPSSDDDDTPSTGSCKPDEHGPPCTSDKQCAKYSGCVRCARTGYCTDQPLLLRKGY